MENKEVISMQMELEFADGAVRKFAALDTFALNRKFRKEVTEIVSYETDPAPAIPMPEVVEKAYITIFRAAFKKAGQSVPEDDNAFLQMFGWEHIRAMSSGAVLGVKQFENFMLEVSGKYPFSSSSSAAQLQKAVETMTAGIAGEAKEKAS